MVRIKKKTFACYSQEIYAYILFLYLELFDQTSTITTSTVQSSTTNWQPGQMKNCTEPGKKKKKYSLIILVFVFLR